MNCNSCRLETQESEILARKILKGRRKKKKRINFIIMKKRICTSIVLLNLGLTRRIKVVA